MIKRALNFCHNLILLKGKLLLLILTIFLFNCQTPVEKYDSITGQSPVIHQHQLDSVLGSLKQVPYEDLDNEYLSYSDPYDQFKPQLKQLNYYVLTGDEVLKFVVGEHRIRDFLTKDHFFLKNEADYQKGTCLYWLVDPDMLSAFLELKTKLKAEGFDSEAMTIRYSHRHPHYNAKSGGASQSQHIYGAATDLRIHDINQDGSTTHEDKKIVIDLLEEIIGDQGGIGRYPGGMNLHFDTRGYRARWDES